MKAVAILLTSVIMFIQLNCTESPFGADEITNGKRQVTGSVVLDDGFGAKGVFVWLEGFDINTRTDEVGGFRITLPTPSAQGTPNGITGIFELYFYLANYELNSVSLATQNGEFIYSQGPIDKDGNIVQDVKLENFLRIKTIVEPDKISIGFAGTINVNIHLQTPLFDSTTIVFPTFRSLGHPFGTIIFRNLNSEELFPFSIVLGNQNRSSHIIGHVEQILLTSISTVQGVLPLGKYEVIPHILIQHEEIPEGLIESIGHNLTQPGLSYLQMPIRREGGQFEVTE